MNMRAWIVIGVVALLVCTGLIFIAKRGGAMDDSKDPRFVKCADIPKNVKLIGRLGFPLGEVVVTIRGKWKDEIEPTKSSDFNFVVTSINGKTVQTRIEIPWDRMVPLRLHGSVVKDKDNGQKWVAGWDEKDRERLPKAFDGDEWELVGFEAGRTVGWPQEVRNMYRHVQQTNIPGTFITIFRFVSVRAFNNPHEQTETGGFPLVNEEAEDVEDSVDPEKDHKPHEGAGTGTY
jgi:hypothetical protein